MTDTSRDHVKIIGDLIKLNHTWYRDDCSWCQRMKAGYYDTSITECRPTIADMFTDVIKNHNQNGIWQALPVTDIISP